MEDFVNIFGAFLNSISAKPITVRAIKRGDIITVTMTTVSGAQEAVRYARRFDEDANRSNTYVSFSDPYGHAQAQIEEALGVVFEFDESPVWGGW
jgi:hypothetical protein